ncbi:PorT family protein [Hyunsoonleella sp. SJ7]|uniref:PorT family protein n=1 Tax=Hyunsoonleella aquatilis TaxID=2762758 RepID=A0A923KHR7_9FLAO|nr:porin family protein [Hyunsoonleella aquatilis]MBC3757209.1 PorT family protein [Hyunsoonleella aquatilis]
MKRAVLVFALVVCSSGAFAQSKVSFGFRGAVNLATLSNSDLDTKTGLYLGAILPIRISDIYTLQPEVGYSNQGGDAGISSGGDVDIHYISITITNKFFVKDSGFNFIIAPSFDFDTDDTFIGLANRVEGNDITFVDMSIGLGVGYLFSNGIGIDFRYKRGLIDVFSDTFHSFNSEQYELENQFNTLFQLGITYQFSF